MDQTRGEVMGLIPAHAGKTRKSMPYAGVVQAHPRSRGENTSQAASVSRSTGSSPLTRGKPPCRRGGRRPRGLIPAHAGKTLPLASPVVPGEAHPRSRGENISRPLPTGPLSGSSPLTRGKPPQVRRWDSGRGLIPAHAGKTRGPPRAPDTAPAHPRSRGENEIARAEDVNSNGSSPLTRGKPQLAHGLD